jgi:ABC-type nitrate/sulfonate/bicarbonate transport system ATPase subunit
MFFDSDTELARAQEDFVQQHVGSVRVSAALPLISNLLVWENVALVKQYHNQFSKQEARTLVSRYLARLDLESVAHARDPELNEEQRFCVMVLRAAMMPDAVLLIDQPFKVLPADRDASVIFNLLNLLDDLYTRCYIFDYTLNQHRYRVTNAEKS